MTLRKPGPGQTVTGSMTVTLELAASERLWGKVGNPQVCSQFKTKTQTPSSYPTSLSPPRKENTHIQNNFFKW